MEAPPIPDPEVAADVPRISIEEMLQDLTISDDKSHDCHVMTGQGPSHQLILANRPGFPGIVPETAALSRCPDFLQNVPEKSL